MMRDSLSDTLQEQCVMRRCVSTFSAGAVLNNGPVFSFSTVDNNYNNNNE